MIFVILKIHLVT